jgi:hypothetical protein
MVLQSPVRRPTGSNTDEFPPFLPPIVELLPVDVPAADFTPFNRPFVVASSRLGTICSGESAAELRGRQKSALIEQKVGNGACNGDDAHVAALLC